MGDGIKFKIINENPNTFFSNPDLDLKQVIFVKTGELSQSKVQHSISHPIFISEELKSKLLILVYQHPPEIITFKKDKLLYIVSLIHEIPARNKRKGLSDGGFANLAF